MRCCQLSSEQQQTSRAEPGSTKCFVCGTTSGTTSERRPDARTTLQPCTAQQGLAAKLSSKRHHHPRLCWPNASFHPWKNEFLDLENHFLELRWGLRIRPLPDLWGSAPERPSTISTGGSSQACAKLYACGTMSGTTSKRRPAVKSSPWLETAPRDPAALVRQQLSKQARSAQCNLLGRSAGLQAGTSRVTNMGGGAQTMSGLEDRLSCMWKRRQGDVQVQGL